jgi:hypothetical protein
MHAGANAAAGVANANISKAKPAAPETCMMLFGCASAFP